MTHPAPMVVPSSGLGLSSLTRWKYCCNMPQTHQKSAVALCLGITKKKTMIVSNADGGCVGQFPL